MLVLQEFSLLYLEQRTIHQDTSGWSSLMLIFRSLRTLSLSFFVWLILNNACSTQVPGSFTGDCHETPHTLPSHLLWNKIRSCFMAVFLQQSDSSRFSPGPMNPQVLGHYSSVRCWFHVIEGALNPIKTRLDTPRTFVPPLYQPIFQSGYRVHSWTILMIDFLLWKYTKYPSNTMNSTGETSRLSAWFLHLQQWGLIFQVVERNR